MSVPGEVFYNQSGIDPDERAIVVGRVRQPDD
jgi:hypothetical protein